MSARSGFLSLAVLAVAVSAGCSTAMRMRNAAARAEAVMSSSSGTPVGTAQLWQDANGTVNVEISSLTLPAGTHGIHFHDVGKCDAPGFTTAGGHYNPMAMEHGLQNPKGPHAGDNPNIVIPAGGVGSVSFSTDRVSLTPGPRSLLDADGTALVVHAGADDQVTNPSGNSGGRIACGVVRALP
ncbi:MAG TPA: superoxide dismutase family protein [Gemmatimonadaceae bacterium]|nr:superoxide dismutase family protein [Gemmatimonadaceae bacterium]